MNYKPRPDLQAGFLVFWGRWVLVLLVALSLGEVPLRAHEGLVLPPPISAGDAWNMLRACERNVHGLQAENRWNEIPIQMSLSIQAARYLREQAAVAQPALLAPLLQLEDQARFVYQTAEREDMERTPREFQRYAEMLGATAEAYPREVREAQVYSCPMCKGVRELQPTTPCPQCGMKLVPRIIPASAIYTTPGVSSVILTPQLSAPLAPGRESAVTLRLARRSDGAPVVPRDLVVMHTERVHLLIVDSTLRDYHHIHPTHGPVPGEYHFALTPQLPGPYRIFADIVPAASNLQEYASCDLPAAAAEQAVTAAPASTVAEVAGRRYTLEWHTKGEPLRARHAVQATVTITDAQTGAPCVVLEPVMGAFAHVVGFHQDRQTVLHLHPLGPEPERGDQRSGPSYTFQFFAPKAGYYRLYSQVQIGGQQCFAPFDVQVVE